MKSRNAIAIWILAAVTILLLFVPEFKSSPAVIWPSVVAVTLAFVTREIYSSLFLGAFAGAVLLNSGNVFFAFTDLFSKYMIPALADGWNISVLMFSLMMGGFIELLNRNGSMKALAQWVLGKGSSKRRAGMGAFGMGWVIFFDGLTNSMLVGKTMRPIVDRAKMSREKLAFIVDSTASPIAAFALISTWIATEMSLIQQGFANVGDAALLAEISPYKLLIESLPYRFYNYFLLLIVFLTVWLGRDIGPMVAAEKRAAAAAPDATDKQDTVSAAATEPPAINRARVWLGAIPVLALVLGVFGAMFVDGGGLERPFSIDSSIIAFGKARADLIFICACGLAIVLAMILSKLFPLPESKDESVMEIFFEGMKQMFLPVLILVFAWTLNGVIKELETANWLVQIVEGRFPPSLLPAVVFLLAAVISFSTGTSWGTMGILMPLAIPVAVSLTGLQAGMEIGPVVMATIGAVLAGSVFGDHCSPISDTTIVSAFASGCDAMEHVRTQLPYAILAAGAAVFLGYGPAGWNVPPLLLLVAGGVACWAVIRYRGSASPNAG